jgi:uncharacterized protein (DUF433 family)
LGDHTDALITVLSDKMTPFTRITRSPAVMGGKACIRGMRVTVNMIVGNVSAGETVEELLDATLSN